MKLPLKTRILQYAIELGQPFTAEDAYAALVPEYQNERLFIRKTVSEYLDSFLGVSFLKADELSFDERGELVIRYLVTDYGKTRQKYMH